MAPRTNIEQYVHALLSRCGLGPRPGRQLLRLRADPVPLTAGPGLCPSAPESVSPACLSSALLFVTLRIGPAAGSTTPPTPGRPGPAYSGPWALPIRSGVCLPCVPILRASLCLDEVWRLVRRYPITAGRVCPDQFRAAPPSQIRSKAMRGAPSSRWMTPHCWKPCFSTRWRITALFSWVSMRRWGMTPQA